MATQLTPDEMKAFVRQHFEDFINNKKSEVLRHNMTSDFLDHDGPGGRSAGVADEEKMVHGMYALGIRVTIDEMVAEGDKVVCRNTWRWNDKNSGTPMEFRGFVEWRFEGKKIAERWATVTAPYETSE